MEDAGQFPVCVRLEAPTNSCSLNSPIEVQLDAIDMGICS